MYLKKTTKNIENVLSLVAFLQCKQIIYGKNKQTNKNTKLMQ